MKKVFSILVALALVLGLGVAAMPVLAQVTPAVVELDTNHELQPSGYNVTFNITGGLTSGVHTITVKFPAGTYVPDEYDTADIIVNGEHVLGGEITVAGTTVTFLVPKDIAVGSVKVEFTIEAGIENPTQGTYHLWVNTSRPADAEPVKSESYDIILGPFSHYDFVYDDLDDIWVDQLVEFELAVEETVEGQEGYGGLFIQFDWDGPVDSSVTFQVWDDDDEEWNSLVDKSPEFGMQPKDDPHVFLFGFIFSKVGVYTIDLELRTAEVEGIAEAEVTAVVTGVSVLVKLNKGWNLISLPIVPDDSDIDVVLGEIMSDVISVHHYRAQTGSWLIRAQNHNSLKTIEDGKAYWINMEAKHTLEVIGQAVAPPGFGPPPPSYDVVEGWNMVGFKFWSTDEDETMTAKEYLKGTDPVRIYGFDLDKGGWFTLRPDDEGADMERGLGYWVAFAEGGTIYP